MFPHWNRFFLHWFIHIVHFYTFISTHNSKIYIYIRSKLRDPCNNLLFIFGHLRYCDLRVIGVGASFYGVNPFVYMCSNICDRKNKFQPIFFWWKYYKGRGGNINWFVGTLQILARYLFWLLIHFLMCSYIYDGDNKINFYLN